MRIEVKRAIAVLLCVMGYASDVRADSDFPIDRGTVVISAESGFSHFGPRLETDGYMQAFNFAARVSLLPFPPIKSAALHHLLDGSFELGLQSEYVRFATQHQNYGGFGIAARYYLSGLRLGRVVPWINWMGCAGGTDLQVKKLNGPFMFMMQAGGGLAWFVRPTVATYLGYQYTHFSNGGVKGGNESINAGVGAVLGVSFFLPR